MLKKTVFYRLICIIALLTLSLNAASPISPTQAKQIDPASPDRPGPAAFEPLTGDSPLAQPSINAKPVLELARQLGDGPEQRIQRMRTPALNKLGEEQAVSNAPEKKQEALVQSRSVDGRVPAALQSLAGLTAGQSAGKLNLPAANPLPALQTSLTAGCSPMLINSDFEGDNATWWPELVPYVYTDTSVYASATTSMWMLEEEDGDYFVAETGEDMDAFGQVFFFPAEINSFDIWLQTAEYAGPGDSLYVFFYEVTPQGDLGAGLGGKYVPLEGTGAWTPHYFSVNYDDPEVNVPAMQGKYIAMVLASYGDNDLTTRYDISIDNVYMSVCTSPTVPDEMIVGYVEQINGQASVEYGLSDAMLLLTYEDATTDGPQVIDFAMPDYDGFYYFYPPFPLPPDGSGWYQVWFMNIFEDDTRVMLWAGPWTDSLTNDDIFLAETFDISNVELLLPTNETVAAMSSGITLQWADRGVQEETYYVCMYDELSELDYNTVCTTGPQEVTSYDINEENFTNVPGFLVDGHRYLWYILPWSNGIGYSYYMNGITILFEEPPDITPPDPDGEIPAGENAREWLLMIYLAGDNNLGDPAMINSPSSFIRHFETLQEIAPAYSNIHVVTLSDFLDSSGTQICYISVSPAECQQLGEQDTAKPQTLIDFIDTAMAGFTHDRAALVISDHGHGVSGVAVDETTHRNPGVTTLDGYMMNPTELRAALSTGLNGAKLDLLYFNTCLMGNLETAYSVANFAEYMVAASNEMWMIDIYTAMLPLFNNPALVNDNLATSLAAAYGDSISALGYPTSIAAYDLSYADDVRLALSNLGDRLSSLYDDSSQTTVKNQVKAIRIGVQQYDSSGDVRIDEEDAFSDLEHLVYLMTNPAKMANADVRTLAGGVKTQLNNLIIYSQQVSGVTGDGVAINLVNASGLSVYFPDRNEGTQLTLTNQIGEKLEYYATGNGWITYTDKFVQYILGNPNTNPGGASTSGPAHIASGVLPPSGALAQELHIYLPTVRR